MNIKKTNISSKSSNRLSVLVVEDNADMARVIVGIFKVKGCKTLVAMNCKEAFKIIQENELDIVSCDINLSGKLTGLDLARMVRGDTQLAHLFLIAVSGFSGEKERAEALNAGFNMFFSKPVKFSDLTKAIDLFSNAPETEGYFYALSPRLKDAQ